MSRRKKEIDEVSWEPINTDTKTFYHVGCGGSVHQKHVVIESEIGDTIRFHSVSMLASVFLIPTRNFCCIKCHEKFGRKKGNVTTNPQTKEDLELTIALTSNGSFGIDSMRFNQIHKS